MMLEVLSCLAWLRVGLGCMRVLGDGVRVWVGLQMGEERRSCVCSSGRWESGGARRSSASAA